MLLTKEFLSILNGVKCELFASPFDVILPTSNSKANSTVVQPDLCIICNKSLINKRGCNGVPDLIVEILSLNNTEHDLVTKFNLYEEVGVKEYWIVDMEEKKVLVYTLKDNKYIGLAPFVGNKPIESILFPALTFITETIFEGIDEIK